MSLNKFPCSDYKFETDKELFLKNWSTFDGKESRGYFLEVTFEFDEKSHALLEEFPPACHHAVITEDMLSPYSQKLLADIKGKSCKYKSKKLIPSFLRRTSILHYMLLQTLLLLGELS